MKLPPVTASALAALTRSPPTVVVPAACVTAKPLLSTAVSPLPGNAPPQLAGLLQFRSPAALLNTREGSPSAAAKISRTASPAARP